MLSILLHLVICKFCRCYPLQTKGSFNVVNDPESLMFIIGRLDAGAKVYDAQTDVPQPYPARKAFVNALQPW